MLSSLFVNKSNEKNTSQHIKPSGHIDHAPILIEVDRHTIVIQIIAGGGPKMTWKPIVFGAYSSSSLGTSDELASSHVPAQSQDRRKQTCHISGVLISGASVVG